MTKKRALLSIDVCSFFQKFTCWNNDNFRFNKL